MGIEFDKLNDDECLFWGEVGLLTGEHKIKASLLKSEFGSRKMVITGKGKPKLLQSPRSKRAHFTSKICSDCNSSGTQTADKAFDQLHLGLQQLRLEGRRLTNRNDEPNFELPPQEKADCFRYFAKMICCFLAEVGGPRSQSLSKFALGLDDTNPIFLRITNDTHYKARLAEMEIRGFAQHGGLKFRFEN